MKKLWEEKLPVSDKARKMLQGAYDIHVHSNPSFGPDQKGFALDDLEIIEQAREAGLKGVCVKNFEFSTIFRDYFVNKREAERGFGSCVYYSSVTLNECIGGINPYAVEFASYHGVKCVWFPTYSSRNTAELFGWGVFDGWEKPNWSPMTAFRHSNQSKGLSILDENGMLIPEVDDIIEITRDAHMILASGHMSPKESYALCKRAVEAGHKKVVLTHPDNFITLVPKEMSKSLAEMGVYIEKTFYSHVVDHSDERAFGHVKEIGAEHFVMVSDLGQPFMVKPAEGLGIMIDDYLQHGFTEEEISQMIRDNPGTLMEG